MESMFSVLRGYGSCDIGVTLVVIAGFVVELNASFILWASIFASTCVGQSCGADWM